jgi:hypothetical protein
MLSVREARSDDMAQVVRLLVNLLGGKAESYESIFSFAGSKIGRLDNDKATRPVGVLLERNDRSVAGFLGVLASQQPLLSSAWTEHMTSWAVAPDARSHGLRMLHYLTETRKGILANFSASAPVQIMLPRFGFTPIDEAELTFSCLSLRPLWSRTRSRVVIDEDVLHFVSDQRQMLLLRDHLSMGFRVVGLEHEGRKIFAILLRKGSGRHAVAQLMHIVPADEDAVSCVWPVLKGFSVLDMKCARISVDARFAPTHDEPATRNSRQMFAKGLEKPARELTRAYGEPLHIWARLPPVLSQG